jgi:hypothetical protein
MRGLNSHTFTIKKESYLYCLDNYMEVMDFVTDCKTDGTNIKMLNLPFELENLSDDGYVEDNAPFIFKLVKSKVELEAIQTKEELIPTRPRRIRFSKKIKMKAIALALKKRLVKYNNYYKFCILSRAVYFEYLLLKDPDVFAAYCIISAFILRT